ncbi:MAG: sulfite reductase subunit alpha [Chthoniobacterales bacterium]
MSSDSASIYSRKNPFPATISVNRKLTGERSEKDTRHFEVSLKGSDLSYEVGDSLGVFPENDPVLVDAILARTGLDGSTQITNHAGAEVSLRDALLKDYILTEPSKQLLQAVAAQDETATFINGLLDPATKGELEKWLWGRDVLDVLNEFTLTFTADEFIKVLRKLQPRLYSIASSQRVVGEEVHLTVASVRYEAFGRQKSGVCSVFIAERAEGEGKVPVFVHGAKHFRLPEDPAKDMIMVGPGTGIAPFRAMLQERKATGASGRNWLFFGEQRSSSDFLYQDEFEAYLADSTLARFDTAFSRDQDFKIYVQHRILEAADELYQWLESGAYFYICGDASRMAKDVDAALHQVVEKAGGKSPEEAAAYIDALKKEKRYRKDVY